MATTCLLLVLTLLSQVGGDGNPYTTQGGDPVLDPCIVKVQDEVRIPAQEAGVLIQMSVREGSRVGKGELLAVIDDREAKMALRVAEYGSEAAKKRAMDKIEERYASKAAEFAKLDWERAVQANEETPNAVPDIEVRQKKLGWQRSDLQIEKAQKDRELAILDFRTKEAEVDAAKMALEMRSIHAPFDGEVVDTYREQSEWVNPGDPILKLVRFDALYVEGYAYAKEFDREELMGRTVTVRIAKSRGREVSVEGTIAHVSQLVQGDGSYVVRAEVQNKKVGENWLIQPGLRARMTVHLSGQGLESRVQGRAPERK
ncbi:MAG: HlyD family efflux transporter periplasmic adaptor subunit [Planctomycetales bacterium]|nr:HlyD family efflux transporter periplasmic adaptor subunit [Planctomycetales bacterium]